MLYVNGFEKIEIPAMDHKDLLTERENGAKLLKKEPTKEGIT